MSSPQTPFSRRRLFAGAALFVGAVVIWLGWRVARPAAIPEEARTTETAQTASPAEATAGRATATVAVGKAEEPWREAVSRPGVDASNLYKDAFVLFEGLTEEEKQMIRKPREEVEAEKAAQLFEKLRAILDLLHRAAQADYCDWGQAPYAFDTPLPQIGKANDLGKLALWAAGYQFPSDPAAALGTLADRAQLGHHIGDTLIGVLVQTGFERTTNELLQQHAGAFDGTLAARAMELLRGSTLDADVARAFEAEQASVEEIGKRLAGAPVETVKMLAGVAGNVESRELAEALTRFSRDPARLAAEIDYIREMERATAAALVLPEAEYQAWLRQTRGGLGEEHPLARMILPSFEQVQGRLQQVRVERVLLGAGLDIAQNGPACLAGWRDPATGRALTYVPTPAGFDLRSTYVTKGKPVTMSFATGR